MQFKERELALREREAAIKERDMETRASLEVAKLQDGREARAEQAINGAQEREAKAAEAKEPKESAPQVIVQNMVGAGGLVPTNWLYNVAPKDGTAISIATSSSSFLPELKIFIFASKLFLSHANRDGLKDALLMRISW
ncbi:MAG: hypothetical protein EBU79_06910, partial [Betaproteobacteria bacterium]|nr:hypothetical protein [Betaproteobacteria bacterium]